MIIDLTGKTALITGSTQGIGHAIAAGLADAGARVILNGRTGTRTRTAAERLETENPKAIVGALAADLTTEEGALKAQEMFPDVDILINNLGIFGATAALEITDEQWRTYFDTNVLSAVRLTRNYLPAMMGNGWGRIINIASETAVVTPIDMIHYGMSKTALLAVSRGFAKAAAGSGVTVNSLLAGPTRTGGVEEYVYDLIGRELPWEDAQRKFMLEHRAQSLLQRLIEPEEIANMAVYLSSKQASATTGAAVRVDGGYIDAIIP